MINKEEYNNRNKWDFHDHLVARYDFIDGVKASKIGIKEFDLSLKDALDVWRKLFQQK